MVFGFPGQYYDQETELHYNWYRFYNPKIGRYVRVDPIGFWGGDLTLYIYVSNAPTNGFDALGLWQYKAFCRYISGGEVFGGGVLKCHIEGPCMRNNKKRICMTKTILFGFTAVSPGGVTYFSMTLDDRDWSPADPTCSKFMGFSHLYSIGGAAPGFGGSYADVKLGSAFYEGFGKQTGVDASVDVFWGYTSMNDDIPQNTWLEDCCYGQD